MSTTKCLRTDRVSLSDDSDSTTRILQTNETIKRGVISNYKPELLLDPNEQWWGPTIALIKTLNQVTKEYKDLAATPEDETHKGKHDFDSNFTTSYKQQRDI